jgi:hypothetical protein
MSAAMPLSLSTFERVGLGVVLATLPLIAVEHKAFTSVRFAYRLRLPRSWNVSVAGSGVPVFFNYTTAAVLPQGLIPDNGADIYLIPFAALRGITGATDTEEWIRLNRTRDHSNVTIRRLPSPGGTERVPRNVFEVKSDFERDPQDGKLQREVNYYFELHGDSFRLRLLYWKGDPRSSYFESVLDSIFRSIRGL